MFALSNRTAVVTGASGGIGSAIARGLHQQGATLGLVGRNKAALDALATELGKNTHVITADLSDPGSVDVILAKSIEAMGRIDILVNNAGVTRDNLSVRIKDEDWRQVIDVNLTATFRLSRSVLRAMLKARWGRIVNITSIVGVTGNQGQANYSASKAGIIGMSKSIASEVASRGVTVNCIAPGFIDTAMTESLSDEQRVKLTETVPAGRLGIPEDVANCAIFLASEEASYVTGQTLHVNGGMAMI
ncbi:MAG: 3-oxoacyl-[acyl-carrier-protein] reductase [Pseudomonadota bacterium]|nr:3-oxoacyl-[acyl-carrier-protein] reductase [Pseudomonadota bacterium]